MAIVASELDTYLDTRPAVAAAEAFAADAATAEAGELIAAEAQIAMGDTALRAITVVTGNVVYEPKVPGQGQPFANWGRSDLRYHRIVVPVKKGGEGGNVYAIIPNEYTTTHSL